MADSKRRADGGKIKSARELKGWSQEQLADKAGYALSVIQKLEQGAYFSSRCLDCCAKALEVESSTLLAKQQESVAGWRRGWFEQEGTYAETSVDLAAKQVTVLTPGGCDRCGRYSSNSIRNIFVGSLETVRGEWYVKGKGTLAVNCHCPACRFIYEAIVTTVPLQCSPYPCPSCGAAGAMDCKVLSVEVDGDGFVFRAALICTKCADDSIVSSAECQLENVKQLTVHSTGIELQQQG